jgi:hypothetical protein
VSNLQFELLSASIPPCPNYHSIHHIATGAAQKIVHALDDASLAPKEDFKVFAMDNIQKNFSAPMKKLSYLNNDRCTRKTNISSVATHLTCASSSDPALTNFQLQQELSPEMMLAPARLKEILGGADAAKNILELNAGECYSLSTHVYIKHLHACTFNYTQSNKIQYALAQTHS